MEGLVARGKEETKIGESTEHEVANLCTTRTERRRERGMGWMYARVGPKEGMMTRFGEIYISWV